MQKKWQFNNRSNADDVVAGHDLGGKVAIVTGANTGIGYETARALASAGARVILACRNADSGNSAVARIQRKHPGAEAGFMPLDLASTASIRTFCQSVDASKIDLLICNAGSLSSSYQETEQGFEHTVGVCHIGHFLLVQLLLPKLLAAGSPRVVMLSSESHKYPKKLGFSTLIKSPGRYSSMKAYGQAKLCNALMALELQNRYGDQGLSACSVHPGTLVTTQIGRDSQLASLAMKLVSPWTKSPSQGAATSVFCAIHDNAADLAGGYFSQCRPAPCSREAKNPEVAARLWTQTEKWLAESA